MCTVKEHIPGPKNSEEAPSLVFRRTDTAWHDTVLRHPDGRVRTGRARAGRAGRPSSRPERTQWPKQMCGGERAS